MILEALEERQLLSVVTGSGGQGGTTKTLALEAGRNKITFWWDNYSIPDEFQILHDGKRIAGDVGLQSGGHSGEIEVVTKGPNESIVVKVTAPLQGTAWDFRVEATPLTAELNASGLLGDVIKINIPELIAANDQFKDMQLDPNGYSLKSNATSQGKVAEIKDWQGQLAKGVFYFVPAVTGQILNYNASRSDPGLGDAKLTIVNGQHEIPLTIHVTDSFSSSGDGAVTLGTEKLDVYRQQQRLAYLGYPGQNGNPLVVDGNDGGNTEWARKLFGLATNPAITGRGKLPNPTNALAHFKNNVNNAAAPYWNDLRGISSVSFPAGLNSNQRFFGPATAGRMITTALGSKTTNSSGVAKKPGPGSPSESHDGGRGFDFIPWYPNGQYYFKTVGSAGQYVAADATQGGGFIYKNTQGKWQGGGQLNNNAQVQAALTTFKLVHETSSALATDVKGLLDYRLSEGDTKALLDAFLSAGSPRILYNDPRFFTATGSIRYYVLGNFNHFNHIHVVVPGLAAGGVAPFASPASAAAIVQALAAAAPNDAGRLAGAVDLGRVDAVETIDGSLSAVQPELIYRFEVGEPADFEAYFSNQPRDLAALLSGLTGDADLELLADPNGDGVGEVFAAASTPGAADEILNAAGLEPGVYYLRVFTAGGDTNFNLTLVAPPPPAPSDGAGNAPADAADLGDATNRVATRADFVGEADPLDYYHFAVTTLSNIDLIVDGLGQGDVSVALGRRLDPTDPAIDYIANSDELGDAAESIHAAFLTPGDYYIVVSRVSGDTTYQLRLTATATIAPIDQAGETLAAARDLGAITGALTTGDFVGDIDPVDVYRFSLASLSGLSVRLSALSADADVVLARDANGDGEINESEIVAASRKAGKDDEAISLLALSAGDYYLIVNQYEGDTTYDLNIAATSPSGADLTLRRTNPTTAPGLGDRFSYTITVTNQGVDAATNVQITDALPNGLVFVGVSPASGIGSAYGSGNQWTGRIANLAAGASASFTVTAYSFITGALRGVTTATADNEYDASNNSIIGVADVATITSPPADLSLGQTVDNALPNVGDQVTITLTLKNNGPGTATEIKVKDALPIGVNYVSSRADLGSYNATTGIWTIGNLPPGVSVALRITVTMTGSTGVINTAEVYSVAEADPNSTPNNNDPGENDQASATIGVVAPTNTVPTLAAIPNQTGNEGTTIRFTARATDAETPAAGLRYSLAPGAPEGATIDPISGAFSWTPTRPGVHTITVIVKDDGSPALQVSQAVTLTAMGVAPVVSLGAGPTVYSYVEFASAGSFADPGAGPYSAVVDYGDGSGVRPLALTTENTFDLRHAYMIAGQYLVAVTVTDPAGLSGTATMIVTASGPAPSGFGQVRDAFVTSLYVTLLNRDPEPRGLRFWSSILAAGARPAGVTRSVWSSREHADLVARGVVPPVKPFQAHAAAMLAARSAIHRPIPRGPIVRPARRPTFQLSQSPRVLVRPAFVLQRGPLVRPLP